MYNYKYAVLKDQLQGKICIDVIVKNDEVHFLTADGAQYALMHMQDCCEHVHLEEVIGDVKDLIGSPIFMAEEISSDDEGPLHEFEESYTWTFYKFATQKGYVTFRWYGSSNGYYSESVNFYEL